MTGDNGSGGKPRGRPFPKGKSGNPGGRPRGKRRDDPASAFDVIMDRTVQGAQEGHPHELTVEEALQLKIYQDAIAGSVPAQRKILAMIQERERYFAAERKGRSKQGSKLEIEPCDPSNADEAMLILGIVSPDARWGDLVNNRRPLLLETWTVQAALSRRRGGVALTGRETEEIRRCTRDPNNLRWPKGTEE